MWPWKWIIQVHWKSVSFLCWYAESQIRLSYVTVHEDGGLIFASVCVLITCYYFFPSYYPSYAIWWIDFFLVPSSCGQQTGICTHDTAVSTSDAEYGIIPWFGLEGACKGHLVQPLSSGGTASPTSGCSEPCPVWSWIFPGMKHPPPLWASCSVFHHCHCKRISSIYLDLTYFYFLKIYLV